MDFPKINPDDLKRSAQILIYQDDMQLFWREQLKLVNKAMQVVPLIPNPTQEPLLVSMQRQMRKLGKIRQIWFKCRQPGGSTASAATLSWKSYLFENVNSFIVAQDKTTVGTIFGMVSTFYDYLSPTIKPMRKYFVKGTEIVLGNSDPRAEDKGLNSKILVGEAKNIHVGVGSTVHCVHLSELARYASAESIKDALMPAFSDAPGTIGIIESTAHFAAGSEYFRSMCERAIAGEGQWEYHFLQWWRLPEFRVPLPPDKSIVLDAEERHLLKTVKGLTLENIFWRRLKIDDLDGDINSFRQNYPFTFSEAWVPRGASCFPLDKLLKIKDALRLPKRRAEIATDGKFYSDPNGRLSIWHEPQPGKRYYIGVDASEGITDGDNTCAQVIEGGSNMQVAEWRGLIDPHELGDVLYHLGFYYNIAQVAPEVEKYGLGVVVRLQELAYPNLYIWQKRDQVTPKYTNMLGWATTHNSKIILVTLARHLIWNDQCVVFSQDLWDELMTFIRDVTPSGLATYNAMPGHPDDCVMAWMIALRIAADDLYNFYESSEQEKKERQVERHVDPAYYDAEGLKPANIYSSFDEWKPWK